MIDGAPVMNGINVLVLMSEAAIRMKRIDGLGVSRRSIYAYPPAAALEAFPEIL